MIRSCKDYITCHGKENIWSQDRNAVREKLVNCVRLNKAYHDSYLHVKEHNYIPDQPPLQFSENYVFGKFDTFCRRLAKIIKMFDLMDDYNCLFDCRMEGNSTKNISNLTKRERICKYLSVYLLFCRPVTG